MRLNRLAILFVLVLFTVSAHSQAKPVTGDDPVKPVRASGLFYYDVGDPKIPNAIVFIHGWTCNADFWEDSLKAFPKYRVLALDLPGHWRSDKPKVDYSMAYFAKAVETVMNNAGVKKAVLVGHSMGMPIAREFYRLHPTRTLAIVNVDGSLKNFFPKPIADQFMAQLKADYKGNSVKFVDGMLTPVTNQKLKQSIREQMLSTPEHVAVSAFENMIDEKIWTEDKINVPMLAIMAPNPFWPADLKESYTAIAPKLELQMWTGVSHFLMMERPAEFNGAVKGFIIRNRLL